ncbi:PucR family transcriptional regulator [Cryobacterium psychrotolerans]|uniref:PucR family transcriptional regulator n=1 Tax=Cryobacterium psychrotolerans TaxID=386301 RepID=UPI000B88FE3A|nr:helix-turn-helix domain-containing protein [Cryobacterium psychrotolerans]TFD84298.1 PucR family transcriptional regulator [Cryobacterium psychrotolerans]
MRSSAEWAPVVSLIDQIAADEHLLRGVVASVRTLVRESAALTTADIVGHTRALIFAATRALADRRGPSETELSFVEDFAATRARQGVPLESVLGAVHVSERTIWARARELAGPSGVSAELLFDVRELYDDWAETVRARLIVAHRAASAGPSPSAQDLDASMLRRLFEGGGVAALAASEAGLPVDRGLWVVVGHAEDAAEWQRELAVSGPGASGRVVSARVDGWFWAVTSGEPSGGFAGRADRLGPAGGYAGPTDPEGLAAARRLASAALGAAQSMGRPGLVHVAEVATQAAMSDRHDIAAMLANHYAPAWRELGTSAEPVARAVVAWLDAGQDVTTAAAHLFVHPNTVRNRLARFAEATGIDPASAFGAPDAWWLCTTWLAL